MGRKKKTQPALWNFLFEGLWVEGISTFALNARFWLGGALVFVAIWTPLNYFSFPLAASHANPLGKPALALVMLLVAAAQTYFFMASFLNQQPIKGSFELSLENFLYMTGVFLLLFLIPVAGELAWTYSETVLSGFGMAIIVYPILAFMIAILLLRFIGVIPLAVNRVKSPFALSWKITSGKLWRLIWNILILSLIISAPLTVIGLIISTLVERFPRESISQTSVLVLSLMDSLVCVAISGLYSAFSYSCCRALYGEYVVTKLKIDRRALRRS